jgi:hypothetical protein
MDEAVPKLWFLKPAQTFFKTRERFEKLRIVESFPVKKEAVELFSKLRNVLKKPHVFITYYPV